MSQPSFDLGSIHVSLNKVNFVILWIEFELNGSRLINLILLIFQFSPCQFSLDKNDVQMYNYNLKKKLQKVIQI